MMKEKLVLGSVIALLLVIVVVEYNGTLVTSTNSEVGYSDGAINVMLLNNAGVMIEADGTRIYIDPYDLPREYSNYPADAILITHDHGDHYQSSVINMLQKDGTLNVFRKIMDTEIARHDGLGVNPEEEFMVGNIKITPFYMYTFSPTPGGEASHPAESNFTSYIVDIGGFTIFHGGDTKNLPEYRELTGTISVAILPLGPGCQTMTDEEVVNAIDVIDPEYFIPIHFSAGQNDQFVSRFRRSIEATTDCEICNMDYYTMHSFDGP